MIFNYGINTYAMEIARFALINDRLGARSARYFWTDFRRASPNSSLSSARRVHATMCKDSQRDQIFLDSVTPNHATANHSDHEGSSTPSPAASDWVRRRIGTQ
jgi:hypothetical protein